MTTKPELKIIADHLRSSCFLIADGVMPSNEGRGYVLRRIMRRAMRQIHKLGAKQAVMYKLVDSLIKEMGTAYPELSRARDTIIDTLKNEEEKFRETLEKGLKILEEEMKKITGISNFLPSESPQEIYRSVSIPGKIAFKLYDTYGFPLDLTQTIVEEKGFIVDVEGFNQEMEKQRNRGKENWSGSGENKEDNLFFNLKEKFGETKFLGYDSTKAKAKILAIEEIAGTSQKIIILNQTPFYATSGGQKGDNGIMQNSTGKAIISETKKFAGNLFIHLISYCEGKFEIGDEIAAEVNPRTRQFRAQNHSATHLLHKALKQKLGNSISQKGSNVDAEYFTFDFNFNRAMTLDEITEVEDLVNIYIRQNTKIKTEIMALEKARESGAEALFGEKYDGEVRVLSMGNVISFDDMGEVIVQNKSWSVELCGGTHAKATGDIGILKIISEKGIAAGIRRIEAKTGLYAIEYNREQEKKFENSLENLQQELKQKDKEIERLKKQILLSGLSGLKSEKVAEVNLLNHVFYDIDAKDLREITNELKAKKDFVNSHIFALFGCKEDKVAVVVAVSNDLLDKFDSAKLIAPLIEAIGGKGGGGKKDLAMGGGVDKNSIKKAVEILKGLVQ